MVVLYVPVVMHEHSPSKSKNTVGPSKPWRLPPSHNYSCIECHGMLECNKMEEGNCRTPVVRQLSRTYRGDDIGPNTRACDQTLLAKPVLRKMPCS